MNLEVAGDFFSLLDNKSPFKPSRCMFMVQKMLLRYCRHSVNSHHSYGFLISHKSPQNYQSGSKLNSVAVIMKGQVCPSIDFSPSSSSPLSTQYGFLVFIYYVYISCARSFTNLLSMKVVLYKHTQSHPSLYFYCCGDFRPTALPRPTLAITSPLTS